MGRGLTAAQWAHVRDVLPIAAGNAFPAATGRAAAVARHGVALGRTGGGDGDELSWESLAQPPGAPVEGWWLLVTGKGGRVRGRRPRA